MILKLSLNYGLRESRKIIPRALTECPNSPVLLVCDEAATSLRCRKTLAAFHWSPEKDILPGIAVSSKALRLAVLSINTEASSALFSYFAEFIFDRDRLNVDWTSRFSTVTPIGMSMRAFLLLRRQNGTDFFSRADQVKAALLKAAGESGFISENTRARGIGSIVYRPRNAVNRMALIGAASGQSTARVFLPHDEVGTSSAFYTAGFS